MLYTIYIYFDKLKASLYACLACVYVYSFLNQCIALFIPKNHLRFKFSMFRVFPFKRYRCKVLQHFQEVPTCEGPNFLRHQAMVIMQSAQSVEVGITESQSFRPKNL